MSSGGLPAPQTTPGLPDFCILHPRLCPWALAAVLILGSQCVHLLGAGEHQECLPPAPPAWFHQRCRCSSGNPSPLAGSDLEEVPALLYCTGTKFPVGAQQALSE